MTPPRQRDPEATRTAILEAAERVFVEKGFADSSMSQIAAEAGVTKSLIHHHFGSKEALWGEVKQHRFGEYAAAQKEILEVAAADAELLRQSIDAYFRFLQKNPDFARLMSWMHLEETTETGFQPGEDLTRHGMEKIREAQEAGALRGDIHPFFILTAFLGLAEHWFICKKHQCNWADEDSEVRDDDRFLDAMQKIFFEGVLPRQDR